MSSLRSPLAPPGPRISEYAFLGVKEYVLFDPLEEYLEPRLRLFRLSGEEYLPVVGNPLTLETVNLELHVVDDELKLRDATTQKFLHPPGKRAEEEAERADKEQIRAEQEAERADKEAQRADKEAQRADREAQRASEAEAELERLRQLLSEREE